MKSNRFSAAGRYEKLGHPYHSAARKTHQQILFPLDNHLEKVVEYHYSTLIQIYIK